MSELILLKLGGSVVTEKGRAGAIDEGCVLSIAREIGKRPEKEDPLVHGAGPAATRRRMNTGSPPG